MDKTTYFTTAEPARPLRKFAAYVLDFLIAGILMIGLFAIEDAIANSTSGVKQNQDNINEVYQDMRTLTESSELAQDNGYGTLLGQSDIVNNYIYGATYQSLKMNDDETISESLYEGYEAINSENDNCYYYYVTFKVEHLDSYTDETVKEKSGMEYYQSLFDEYFPDKEWFEWIDGYPYLTHETATAINGYFLQSTYSTGYDIYTSITDAYSSWLSNGVSEFQEYYQPYLDLLDSYNTYSTELYNVKTIELIIAYVIAYALYYVLLPILLKDGRTLSFKVMTMGVVNFRQERLSWYNIAIRYVMHLFEEVCTIMVVALIFFGTSGLDLIGRNFLGSISFLSIGLLSMLMMLVDFFFSFAMRRTCQTLSEFISQEIVKDGKMFDAIKQKDLTQDE